MAPPGLELCVATPAPRAGAADDWDNLPQAPAYQRATTTELARAGYDEIPTRNEEDAGDDSNGDNEEMRTRNNVEDEIDIDTI